jgi:hypothetical protein
MKSSSTNKKVTAGFALAMVAGALVLINGAMWFWLVDILRSLFGFNLMVLFSVLGSMAIIFAVVIFIGALLIYLYKKELIGGIIVLIVSIFSMGVGGGFVIGSLLGILGSVLILLKK